MDVRTARPSFADTKLFAPWPVNPGVSAINRWNRGPQIDRAGELLEIDSTDLDLQLEQELLSIEALGRVQNRFQDSFDAITDRFRDGFEVTSKQRPVELGLFDKLLTTAEFQERLKETLDGTSARAQQVKQVESVYEAYFQDSEDFSMDFAAAGPALTSPEVLRYEAPAETAWKGRAMTVPEFQVLGDVPEAAPLQEANQASAVLQQARRAATEAEQPFSPRGRATLRG